MSWSMPIVLCLVAIGLWRWALRGEDIVVASARCGLALIVLQVAAIYAICLLSI